MKGPKIFSIHTQTKYYHQKDVAAQRTGSESIFTHIHTHTKKGAQQHEEKETTAKALQIVKEKFFR